MMMTPKLILVFFLAASRGFAQLPPFSFSTQENNVLLEADPSVDFNLEAADAPYQIRLVQQLSYGQIPPFQDAGYCVQSISVVEPSAAFPNYQIAYIFSRQPSCAAWFVSNSVNVTDFVSRVQAATTIGYIPTQAGTATQLPPALRQFKFISFAEYVRGVKAEVRYMEATSAVEKQKLAVAGSQLLKLIGLDVDGTPGHIGVWVKPAMSFRHRQAHYGLTLADCMQLDQTMAQNGRTPVQFQVFGVASKPYCTAIWEDGHVAATHQIQTGTDLPAMVSQMQGSGLSPIQISSYIDDSSVANFLILWSSLPPYRYAGLWEDTPAPMNYLAGSQEGFQPADLAKIDTRIRNHMKKQSIMSLSYAISKNERLKIAAAYGYSNPITQTPISTENGFRIASISKPITSTGIYRLIEMGRLRLDQKIFGQGAIFGTIYGTQPYSERVKALQLIHLLQHTEGGWSGRENDGIPDPTGILPNLNADQLISYVIDNYPLNFTAGVHFRYCNFGYLLLSQIVETVTGEAYEQFQQHTILTPQMMTQSHIGYNGMAGRLPNEIVYTDHDGSIYAFDMLRNRGNSGWVSTAVDLLKFIGGVNGFPLRRDLLHASTLEQMVRPSAPSNYTYASGWITSRHPDNLRGRGHNGGLSGIATFLWRRDDGVEFSILMSGYSNFQTVYRDAILGMVAIVDEDITRWPVHDLYG